MKSYLPCCPLAKHASFTLEKTYQCDDCGEVTTVHHSCGDRHCPVCSGRKRYDFAVRAEELILDDVTYYQVVFTLPSELSEMALANRTELAELATCADSAGTEN